MGNPNRSLDDASFLVDASQRGFEGTDRISSSRLHGNTGAFYKHLLVWFDCRFLLRHCFCIRCHFPADCQHQWMNIRSTRDIHCSLERFSTGHNSCLFSPHHLEALFSFCFCFTFLDPAAQFRLARAHVVILVDRAEVALSATAHLLGNDSFLSSFTVPTPPLQEWPIANHHNGSDSSYSTGSEAEVGGFNGFT